MSKKDISSITYLFNEMDPSEEMEFERQVEEDANLLIEVESFKKVNERLSELPKFSAPESVLNSVMQDVSSKGMKPTSGKKFPFYYTAAALIIAGFTAGALLLDNGAEQVNNEHAASAGLPVLQLETHATSAVSQSENSRQVAPWVDNNEVLRFSDRFRNVESASIDSILRDSYQRLTPVTDPQQSRYYQRNLHLTGSRQ